MPAVTLEIAVGVFAGVLLIVVIGGTVGNGMFAYSLIRQHEKDKAESLAVQAEMYKNELRELTAYSARLEDRVSDMEAQIKVLMQALWDARIPVPKTGPLTFNTSGDLNVGGPITGRDARP